MPRALFVKTGNAIYISHLDLMRLFQRSFKRAGLPLTHTQGFSPRPSVSIALPMSVGVESRCELLDFDLEGEQICFEEIKERLNDALTDGIEVLCVYHSDRKIRDIALLDCTITMEYDREIPLDAQEQIASLFSQESLVVEKRNKNGISQQNVIPLIRSICVNNEGRSIITVNARLCCQNPALNPAQMVAAIERYLPEMKPDFYQVCRLEIYDQNETIFR